jgi:N-dimethylarginine dimethylaminohydrolase
MPYGFMYGIISWMDDLRPTRIAAGGTPRSSEWGVDSEHAALRDVLVGDPHSFRWLGEENSRYSALVRESIRQGRVFDPDLAIRQHGEMVEALGAAGANVHVLGGRPELGYGVFTRDSGVLTPFGAILCQLANPRRRGEYATTLGFYAEHGIPVYELVTAGNFEGGDFAMVAPDAALIGYTGTRTEEVAARQVGDWLAAEGIDVCYAPIDEFFVHIDVLVSMLAERLAAVCVDVCSAEVLAWLKGRKIEIVPVSYREAMSLGGNVLALGDDRVLSSASAPELNARLRAEGFEVSDPELTMFQWAGGGVHCLCQPLRRDPA